MRAASAICRTGCKIIRIHRDAFHAMIDMPDVEGLEEQGGAPSAPQRRSLLCCTLGAKSAKSDAPTRVSQRVSSRTSDAAVRLESSFAESARSRSEQSSASWASGSARQLLERAVAARSTLTVWCDLVGLEQPSVATRPLPQLMTEMQARLPRP